MQLAEWLEDTGEHLVAGDTTGDVNQNGSVLADDFSGVKKRFFKDTSDLTATDTSYSPLYDVTGDGTILANDFSEVKKRFFDTLPAATAAALLA